ncbi:MAG: CBS domain-containing protein [Dongiaceae bacterium]
MRASDVMRTEVVTCAPDSTIAEAIRLMLDKGISGLPVVDAAGALVGIVTEGDFLRRAELGTERRRPRWLELLASPGRIAADYVQSHGRRVAEVMTPDVAAVAEDTPLPELVRLMEHHRVKRLPVLRDGRLVGLVARADLLRALAAAAAPPAAPGSDDAIRAAVLAALAGQPWAPADGTRVAVADGVVTISGVVFDDEQRAAIRVAIENVPGVRGIEDDLTWIEPMSGMVIEPPPGKEHN